MSRGRKRIKKNINPLVENIADFSDIEYDDDDGAELIASMKAIKGTAKKKMKQTVCGCIKLQTVKKTKAFTVKK